MDTTDVLFEGVPDHLAEPLESWALNYLTVNPSGDHLATKVAVRLRLQLITMTAGKLPERVVRTAVHERLLLDLVDAAIHLDDHLEREILESRQQALALAMRGEDCGPLGSKTAQLVQCLDDVLTQGGSAYQVDWQLRGLIRRVDPAISAVAGKVMADNARSGPHLQAAWVATYGLHPDPAKAYDEAVRAVEAAAIPVVLPNGTRETLGKVRAHLRDAAAKWQLAVEGQNAGDVAPAVAMIGLLWEGHVRHEGAPNLRPQRQDEAEMAVHLAATLVQWFQSGAIRRRSAP